MKKYFLYIYFLALPFTGTAARFIEPVELQFTVEDGEIGEDLIVDVLLDDKSVVPEKTSFFDPKLAKVPVTEGVHVLKWLVRKKDFGRGKEDITTIEKVLEIERGDKLVYINIRGKKIALIPTKNLGNSSK